MSATVTDDAFLVKGLQLKPETIMNPISYSKESWSGEKMVLLPSLIHDSFDRKEMVSLFGPKYSKRYGTVALMSGSSKTKDWKAYGSLVANKETISSVIDTLRKGEFENTVVLVNRYDGIDLSR